MRGRDGEAVPPPHCVQMTRGCVAATIVISLTYIRSVTWEIILHKVVDEWFLDLCENDPDTAELIEEALDVLATKGPALGRPLVDHIKASQYHQMKELRAPSAGRSEIRILFAFDPRRTAICLVTGDKAGRWQSWYVKAVPLADQRFAEHLNSLELREGDV